MFATFGDNFTKLQLQLMAKMSGFTEFPSFCKFVISPVAGNSSTHLFLQQQGGTDKYILNLRFVQYEFNGINIHGAAMEKVADAVSANFFHLCNFFGFSQLFCTILRIFAQFCCVFAQFCTILQWFCTFLLSLLIFARLCIFLHLFFVLIFQAQKLF